MNRRIQMLLQWILVLVLSASSFAAEPSAPLTANANLVVLVGMPGDVETEKTYEGQVKELLEILAIDGNRPKKLFLMVDQPGSFDVPAVIPSEIRQATRDDFLAVAGELKGDKTPLVVMAWGHAGLQGQTPVFHVRGRRIASEDFKTLADASPEAPSSWILFFRGSGSFSEALNKKNRKIFASENKTPFADDPVGLAICLKEWRNQPNFSFDALAAKSAEAIGDWYTSRTLARTEEPTLWQNGEESRMLVVEKKETGNAGASPASGSPAPDGARTAASAAWKEIKRVDPKKFPGENSVILRRYISYTFGSNPAVIEEMDQFVQILSDEGKHEGDFEISYEPPSENLAFVDCEVMAPDGLVTRMDPDAIRDGAQPQVGDYPAPRVKMFSFPGVVPGSILRVHYNRTWARFPMPHVTLSVPATADIPMLESEIDFRISKQSVFRYAWNGFVAGDPVVKQSSYGTSYTWKMKDVPAQPREPLSSPAGEAVLWVSTFPDWKSFSTWYSQVIRESDQVTPEIKAKADEVVRGATNDREKVAALYNYVTAMRYVAVELGVNSYRPHAAANVLRNQYGDCKDKANLFNALLKSQGIEADLVLVPRFTQASDQVPGMSFNHAISRVKLGNEILWVDTTDGICRFGMLPPGDSGRWVFVIDGKTETLTRLPDPSAKNHRLIYKAALDATKGWGAPPTIAIDVSAEGFADYQMRMVASPGRGASRGHPLLFGSYNPLSGVFELSKQDRTAVGQLNQNYQWHGEGRWHGLVTPVPAGDAVQLRAPWIVPLEWQVALDPRQTPLFLNEGYPLLTEQTVEITLPPGAHDVKIPAVREQTSGILRWRLEWSAPTAGKMTARLNVELTKGELNLEETRKFQEELQVFYSAIAEAGSCVIGR